jgi:hypothetical protein
MMRNYANGLISGIPLGIIGGIVPFWNVMLLISFIR